MSPLVQKFNGISQLALKILGGLDWLRRRGRRSVVHGERWRVRSGASLAAGDRVRVAGVDGLTLDVTKDSAQGS